MAEKSEHYVPARTYITVLGSLMGLLVLTVVFTFIDIDRWTSPRGLGSGWNTAIALTIAIAKGMLILLFFMHLKYGSHTTWAFAAAGFVWLSIMLTLTMTDYLSRNHPPE